MPKTVIEASPEKVLAYMEARERKQRASGRKLQLYFNDPVAFIHDCVAFKEGEHLTAYQEEVISQLPLKKRVTQVGPHGLGKTTTAALLILWFALTRDGAGVDWKCPVTAGAWRQLEQYLMPEVHKWARCLRWEKIGRDPFKRGELLTLNLNLSHGSAFAVASNVPAYIEGAHADQMLYIFDESKALDLNTPIPTPTGWTTMGDIVPGDTVLDEQGLPCRVTNVSPVFHNHKCHRVVFDDGEEVVADAGHRWAVLPHARRQSLGMTHKNDARYKKVYEGVKDWRDFWSEATVVTTPELKPIPRGSAIPTTRPLNLPEVELPTDPYLMGQWLGDGSSWGSFITTADPETVEEIRRRGYTVKRHESTRDRSAPNYGIGNGFRGILRELGLLKTAKGASTKFIPASYLRASYQQRLDLLRGLMDSDGCVMGTGSHKANDSRVAFSNTNERLARDTAELVRTLGCKVTVRKYPAMLNGVDHGPVYTLRWSADVCPFLLERKAQRWRPRAAQASSSTIRTIRSVDEVESVPTRCIMVDSPNHLFLCGEGFIPTHNSIIDATFDAAEGAFSGAGTDGREAYALASSTPGEPFGRFYDLHARKLGFEDWWPRHVTLEEAIEEGRINREWAERRAAQWGIDSQLYANRVLGEFHASDEDSVIPSSWVELANERWLENQSAVHSFMDRLGVDVANTGTDKTVLAPIHGHRVDELDYYAHNDTTLTRDHVLTYLDANSKAIATIDADGVGVGVFDVVREQLKDQSRVRAFHASAATDWKDASGELGFINARAAAWWRLRDMLDPAKAPTLELPPDDQLIADLSAPKWKETGRGKIQVESKDEVKKRLGGRSTDSADAVIMGLWQQRKRRRRRMGNMGFGPDNLPPHLRLVS
jgi:hypothetical protein